MSLILLLRAPPEGGTIVEADGVAGGSASAISTAAAFSGALGSVAGAAVGVAIGIALALAVGVSDGSASLGGQSAAVAAAESAGAGIAVVSGDSGAIAVTVGNAEGVAVATGLAGAQTVETEGSISASASVLGVGALFFQGNGVGAALASATAGGAVILEAVGKVVITTVTEQDKADIAALVWANKESVVVESFSGSMGAMADSAQTMMMRTVDTAALTPTTTQFECNLVLPYADHIKGRGVFWRTGNLAYHAARVDGYQQVSGRGRITVTTMPAAPAHGDTFVLV